MDRSARDDMSAAEAPPVTGPALRIGARLGRYEILAPLGAGGMGEVWRARDSRLGREVAIKVLPRELTTDPAALSRFEREARAVAALSHPNILALHDFERDGETVFAVTELLAGQTLRERLRAGPVPVRKVREWGAQVARALSAAHDGGIVHRDVKPENLFLTRDDVVKLLDFGVARQQEPAGATGGQTSRTTAGVVLGTVGYMAPEQVRAEAVDGRADVFALGCVLYELLTGKRAFAAPSMVETLSAILTQEPAGLDELERTAAPELARIVRRCLEKRPERRFQSAHDLAFALETGATPTPATAPTGPEAAGAAASAGFRPWRRRRLAPAVAAAGWLLAAAVVAWGLWWSGGRDVAPAEPMWLDVGLPPGVEPLSGGFGLSADGRTLAMVGTHEGQRHLYLRRLDSDAVTEVDTAVGAHGVAFSPEGSRIAVVSGDGQLVTLSLLDQRRDEVARGADPYSNLVWGEAGIYFQRDGGLWLLPRDGGPERRLTELDARRGELTHREPVELPGARRVLFTSRGREAESARIETLTFGGGRAVVLERATVPAWSPSGHLLFRRQGGLWAIPFDPREGTVSGTAVPVVRAAEMGPYQLAANGTLVYVPPQFNHLQMLWVDRQGTAQPIDLPADVYGNPRLSPAGRQLLYNRPGGVEVLDLERHTRAAGGEGGTAVWMRDGRRVVLKRFYLPHWVAVDGSGRSGSIPGSTRDDYPNSAGPDDDTVLIVRLRPQTSGDLYLFSLDGSFPPRPLLQTPAHECGPQLSPDGKWLLYQSNASGRHEIYLGRFPALGRSWQVSEGGGMQARWSRDGREIYYRGGGKIVAATFDGGGAEPVLGRPAALFADEYAFEQISAPNYDVAPDGRFVMLRRTPASGRLRVVLRWDAELERLLASGGVR